ncbi:putative squalene monooxygenase [Golovinomyces cichoracearum]|uniref:Squalene monooxygenase n=1 Tax=Golovinomyces cichoracearum TaxID=62708 RepID=A0A420J7V1_9PEZI|nr:putative squalene monooxygenase [Golovinomyces cichoracearum]
MDLNSIQEPDWKARRIQQKADVLIVGAGVFGCAMAFALANQGRSVILLEKSLKQPDRIVGELLQPGGVSALEKLGLSQCLEGIDSVPVHGYQVIYHGTSVSIPYPSPKTENAGKHQYTSLKEGKPEGRTFHHGRFISQLRKACFNHPNITVVETLVLETIKNTLTDVVLGVRSETMNEKTKKKEKDFFFGDLTIIADGYASKFRKQYIDKSPVVKSKFYALELIDCPLPVPYYGTVILGDGSPVLLYQIGTHETRALIDVPENTPSASVAAGGIRNHIRNVVLPSLPLEVQPFFEKAMEDGKIPRSMPNSWLPPSMQQQKGVILLGDAMNMRHPLTGGGMTVALNDVVYLSELLSPDRVPLLEDTAAIQKAMKEFHWERKSLSSVINILAMALYSLFAANDRQLKALQRGCFAYFQKGGNCVDGPVGLLAGIIRQPIVLFYHFFAVAFVSIWITVSETMGNLLRFWKLPLAIRESTLIFWKACVVILPFIFSEIQK